MKKYILLLLLAVITMNYQACQPKNDRIADLKDFVEEIAEDGQDYTSEQWEKANEKFTKLLDKINSYDDLSEEEL